MVSCGDSQAAVIDCWLRCIRPRSRMSSRPQRRFERGELLARESTG